MKSWTILVIGVFMFFAVMLSLPMTQAFQVVGENLTPYTANASYWVGFTESVGFIPLIVIFLAVVIPVVAWWKAFKAGE